MLKLAVANENNNAASSLFWLLCETIADWHKTITSDSYNDLKKDGAQLLLSNYFTARLKSLILTIRQLEVINMTKTSAHHIFWGHCVKSEVTVLGLSIFLREHSSQRNIPRWFHTMTKTKMVQTKLLLSLITDISNISTWISKDFCFLKSTFHPFVYSSLFEHFYQSKHKFIALLRNTLTHTPLCVPAF